jgi:hypothetical protein
MTNPQRLALVRAVHTVIYVVMASSVFAVLNAGASGARGAWLWGSLALVGIEVAIFVGSGMKCPLTNVAEKYGAPSGADTYFPVSITRHTLAFFGPLIVIGVALLAARWSGVLP